MVNSAVRLPAESILGHGTTLVLAGVAALLVLGLLMRGTRWILNPSDEVTRERLRSLFSWSVLFLVFLVLLVSGPAMLITCMAAASCLLLWDTLRLARAPQLFAVAAPGAILAFVWVWVDRNGTLMVGTPLLAIGLVLGEWGWRSLREGEIRIPSRPVADAILVGMIGPLFAAGIALRPAEAEAAFGWFVLLVLLTGLNDSAQAWWGRLLGRHPMAPTLSPHKTWEGLVGGLATTLAAAVILAPVLTPFGREIPLDGAAPGPPWLWSLVLGLGVGTTGAAGDLLGSILKRRAGVKDSGSLIPGQGGILDRLDSLTLTAPFFFLLVHLLWGPGS